MTSVIGCRSRSSFHALSRLPNLCAASTATTAACAWLLMSFGCESLSAARADEHPWRGADAAYTSTYKPRAHPEFIIKNATVLTGAGERLADEDVRVKDARIVQIGTDLRPGSAVIIDGSGKWLTPGLIDVHSHLGDYPAPDDPAHSDGNESTAPVTAEVWAEHSVWPQDPQFALALAGGLTTLQVLPGSANLIGGRGVTLKNVPARSVQAMKLPDAPYGLKMACGENPKRVYGERKQAPSTRMGNVAGYRAAWAKAADYMGKWQRYAEKRRKGEDADPPDRDIQLETLAGVLDGSILVHNHCYRADEMAVMLAIAKEYSYRISTFHHATEAYKVADLLAENQVCAAMWSDWWGFKLESFDGIQENIALVDHARACAIVHSDSPRDTQRLNQEAAKAMMAGRRMGLSVDEAQAIRWITQNPAKALGIDEHTGTIAKDMDADLVLWSGNPFSVYSRAEQVWIDGYLYYDRNDPTRQPISDFDVGTTARSNQVDAQRAERTSP